MQILETVRHPFRTINTMLLSVGNYAMRFNPNQTTALGTLVTIAGTTTYVIGIISGNHTIAFGGIGLFATGRYADLLDGDHAMIRRQASTPSWNTKSGGIFDADMDKVGIYATLGALAYTNTLPDTHKYIILGEIAIMGILDGISYGMRSHERDWKKIWESLWNGRWEESKNEEHISTKRSKNDANAFGKIKTLLQTLGITALGVGALISDEKLAHDFQKIGHPLFLSAIGFAGASLWSKMKKK